MSDDGTGTSAAHTPGGSRGRRSRRRRSAAAVAAGPLAVLLAACGPGIPTDPDGTLDAVTGETLHVGVSVDPGLVEADRGEATGPLAELAEDFAASLDAGVEWRFAGEETLVTLLEEGEIELAIGGFTDRTPWAERVGVTRGYSGIPGTGDRTIVMLVPMGENAFLSELESFLDAEVGS